MPSFIDGSDLQKGEKLVTLVCCTKLSMNVIMKVRLQMTYLHYGHAVTVSQAI